MISHINGKLVEKTPTYVVIDCNGVGYKLNISLQTYSSIQTENCKLLTHLAIKEDSHTLYGFCTSELSLSILSKTSFRSSLFISSSNF